GRVGVRLSSAAERVRSGVPAGDLIWQVARACLEDYAAQEVFSRDLLAPQADGLLFLYGLEHPIELAGCTVGSAHPTAGPAGDREVIETLRDARSVAGAFMVLDGPEYSLARLGAGPEQAGRFAR